MSKGEATGHKARYCRDPRASCGDLVRLVNPQKFTPEKLSHPSHVIFPVAGQISAVFFFIDC